MKRIIVNAVFMFAVWTIFIILCTPASARKIKMFDISQTAMDEWGSSWCAPTAVGNSFAWLAKEYKLDGLMKVNGTGAAMSAETVIHVLGNVDMDTGPETGTLRSKITQAKKDYIERHGYKDIIKIESKVGMPIRLADGSFGGYSGDQVSSQWLKQQYDKGQDVEFSVSYYEKSGEKWYRTGGHADVYDGDVPGFYSGGHMLSMSNIFTPGDDPFSDFVVSFTDPGRDDLAGEYGAIASDQYWLEDYAGNNWFNTESTYNVIYDPDPFGVGIGGLLLDGYQGEGDFISDGDARTHLTIIEAGWAESPIPEPSTVITMLIGLAAIGLFQYGRIKNHSA